MAKKIPPYITDDNLRLRLAVLAKALDTLKKEHFRLAKKAKAEALTSEEKKTRLEIVKGVNDLENLWDRLVPKLSSIRWPDDSN